MPRARLPLKPQSELDRRERRSQLRGLLLIALIALAIILVRADRRGIFHAGWWRF